MHQFFEFIEYHSTCFGRSFRPSSGVQDCTYSVRCMSYRLVDCLLAGTGWNYHSTCFGRSFRPLSGVQDCTYSIRYTSYRLVDCLLAGTGWNYHSTRFGRSFRPLSGVQDCTYSIRYTPYRLVDCLLAGTGWNESTYQNTKRNIPETLNSDIKTDFYAVFRNIGCLEAEYFVMWT